MKIKISLDITDDRSERSARSSTRVGPPTDAIRQLLIVGYRSKRRGVGLSSILEKLCSSGGCVPECRYSCGDERGDNGSHRSYARFTIASGVISRIGCCLPLESLLQDIGCSGSFGNACSRLLPHCGHS